MQTEIINLIEQAKKEKLDQLQTMSFVLGFLNDKYALKPNDESMIRATVIDEMMDKKMNIEQAIKYLQDHRYEITQKDYIYFLNDIDDSISQLEAYNEKELIALAEQLKEEFSK